MKCLKCGAELNSSYEMPLCRNCESKGGHVFKLSDPRKMVIESIKQYFDEDIYENALDEYSEESIKDLVNERVKFLD